jgi:hypothetical protein
MQLFIKLKLHVAAALLVCAPVSVAAQIAAGGAFTLEKSVFATGGGTSANGSFALAGTGGQTAAGTTSNGVPFMQSAGFWVPDQLAPSAAGVLVEGRVTTADGRGIRNARVSIRGTDGVSRTVITGSFGYFRFTDVAAGDTYLLNVFAKQFIFSTPTQILTIVDNVTDLKFTAENDL